MTNIPNTDIYNTMFWSVGKPCKNNHLSNIFHKWVYNIYDGDKNKKILHLYLDDTVTVIWMKACVCVRVCVCVCACACTDIFHAMNQSNIKQPCKHTHMHTSQELRDYSIVFSFAVLTHASITTCSQLFPSNRKPLPGLDPSQVIAYTFHLVIYWTRMIQIWTVSNRILRQRPTYSHRRWFTEVMLTLDKKYFLRSTRACCQSCPVM